MSYFLTFSGNVPEHLIPPGCSLIPASGAQNYIRALASKIEALDGGPVYLLNDPESFTSDSPVCTLLDGVFEGAEIEQLPIYKLLNHCFVSNVRFRLWFADNSEDAYTKYVVQVKDMEELCDALSYRYGACNAAL